MMAAPLGIVVLPLDLLACDGVAHVPGKSLPRGLLRHAERLPDLRPAVPGLSCLSDRLPHRLFECGFCSAALVQGVKWVRRYCEKCRVRRAAESRKAYKERERLGLPGPQQRRTPPEVEAERERRLAARERVCSECGAEFEGHPTALV